MSPTSILVEWGPPSELDRNGVITHYIVKYSSLESKSSINTTDNATQIVVRNLRKYTNYSFSVQAVNKIGVGPPSVDDVRNTTSEDGKCVATFTVIVVEVLESKRASQALCISFDLLSLRVKIIEAVNQRIGYEQYREGQQCFQNQAKFRCKKQVLDRCQPNFFTKSLINLISIYQNSGQCFSMLSDWLLELGIVSANLSLTSQFAIVKRFAKFKQ